MKNILYSSVMVALALIVSNGSSVSPGNHSRVALAQEPSSSFERLTLRISSNKQSFVKLEPVPILLTLINETTNSIQGHNGLEFSENQIELFVGEGNGGFRQIKYLSAVRDRTRVWPRLIAPGEKLESRQLLALGLNEVFPQKGPYRIYIVLHGVDWKQKVKSNVLMLKIREPEGTNRLALEYLEQRVNTKYFFSGLELSGRKSEQIALEEFVATFGESIYGDYASFLLAQYYFSQGDYGRARPHFDRLAGKPDFVFADKASDYLVKSKRNLNSP